MCLYPKIPVSINEPLCIIGGVVIMAEGVGIRGSPEAACEAGSHPSGDDSPVFLSAPCSRHRRPSSTLCRGDCSPRPEPGAYVISDGTLWCHQACAEVIAAPEAVWGPGQAIAVRHTRVTKCLALRPSLPTAPSQTTGHVSRGCGCACAI